MLQMIFRELPFDQRAFKVEAPLKPVSVVHGALRVHVPNNYILGILVILIVVLVLGKFLIIRYLDP